jgi:hypothetical protein
MNELCISYLFFEISTSPVAVPRKSVDSDLVLLAQRNADSPKAARVWVTNVSTGRDGVNLGQYEEGEIKGLGANVVSEGQLQLTSGKDGGEMFFFLSSRVFLGSIVFGNAPSFISQGLGGWWC